MDTVFPSTTASVITTVFTWVPPSEHGIIGWNIYEKEALSIIQPLPYTFKNGKFPMSWLVSMSDITPSSGYFHHSHRPCFVVTHKNYLTSPYNMKLNVWATVVSYSDLEGCFDSIASCLETSHDTRFINAYWGEFDGLCHEFGIASAEAYAHFKIIDEFFETLAKEIAPKTLLMVTADHWQWDVHTDINLKEDAPELYEMLLMPLAGEGKTQYVFLKHGFEAKFITEMKLRYSQQLDIYTPTEILEMGIFGPNPKSKFLSRLGDAIIIAKAWYTLTDGRDKKFIGNHAGNIDWEMEIPLIIIENKEKTTKH